MNMQITPSPEKPLRIGTRKSPLAMVQTNIVADKIRAAHNLPKDAVTLVPMLSVGDKIQDRPLAEIGGKALWTKELERALIDDEIDIAVHSMKDVETIRPDHFTIAAMLTRADIRDRLIGAIDIQSLKQNALVGTSSPRRAAQLRNIRPDLQITSLRGNVATRLSKIDTGDVDATLLAAAGLDRLSMTDKGSPIQIDEMLPAAAQGAIGIDCLSNNITVQEILTPINHTETFQTVMAERMFLKAIGGDCHSPLAASASIIDGKMILKAEILTEDGQEKQAGEIAFNLDDTAAPQKLAKQLYEQASPVLQAMFNP